MRCALCGGTLRKRVVEEEISTGKDRVVVKVKAEICLNCHERYFEEGVVDRLIELKEKMEKNKLNLREIGKVYKLARV